MQWQMSVDITGLTGRMRCGGIARLQLIPKKESKGFANDLLQGADKIVRWVKMLAAKADPWDPSGGRTEPTSGGCSLISTSVLWHITPKNTKGKIDLTKIFVRICFRHEYVLLYLGKNRY